VINIKTDKYNNMISAFQCDFSLARNGDNKLSDLDDKIKQKDSILLKI
jgi:hypothetical protein